MTRNRQGQPVRSEKRGARGLSGVNRSAVRRVKGVRPAHGRRYCASVSVTLYLYLPPTSSPLRAKRSGNLVKSMLMFYRE